MATNTGNESTTPVIKEEIPAIPTIMHSKLVSVKRKVLKKFKKSPPKLNGRV